MSNNLFFIYNNGTGSYQISELQAVYAKLRQELQAADYGATFSLLGDDGNTYNFFNNLPMPAPMPAPSPTPNNYPNFIPVVQFEGFTPATPTSNTTSYASKTTIILIISTVVLSTYYYKTKYSR